MPTGQVARFDPRRGYGFVIPDDGGEDVFVHQNNIEMDGFRYLKPGEQVRYELEVGEKGLKAVDVALLNPRQENEAPPKEYEESNYEPRENRRNNYRRDRGDRNDDYEKPRRRNYEDRKDSGGDNQQVEKLRRKQERLISLLVEKGVLSPGEVDGLERAAPSMERIDLASVEE